MLAPIVLFVYNRPWHTDQTLKALMLNELADESELFIYCDGPKPNALKEELNKIIEVKEVIRKNKWCNKVTIIESDNNLGLANSVIKGVTEVVERFGKVIVLEDDIISGEFFLKFMNMGLNLYKEEDCVYGVSGYSFPYKGRIKEETYFLPIMSSWGYGTWLDSWKKINFDGEDLLEQVKKKELDGSLDFGDYNFYQMLKDQVAKVNDSWAIRFYVSMFLNKGLFLYPNTSLIKNIGFDGTGVHCEYDKSNLFSGTYENHLDIKIKKKKIRLKPSILKKFNKKKGKVSLKKKLKQKVKKIIAPEIIKLLKRKFGYKKGQKNSDLINLPRYTTTTTKLEGHDIIVPDNASFLFMYKEIFKEHIYKFRTTNKTPYIIDGGANIGLATIYLKLLYPNSEILVFEPDNKIYNILENNINSFNFKNIKLINKGLWNENKTLSFHSEGADGGAISELDKSLTKTETIVVTSLKPYLNKKVDFLKLDIEGAETTVLKDIKNELINVDKIFIEYHSFVNKKQTLNEIVEILTNSKFRLHISSPGLTSKSPFVKINEYNNMDMQLNIFGFKV